MQTSADFKKSNLSPKQKFYGLVIAVVVMGPFIYSGSLPFLADRILFQTVLMYLPILYLPLLYLKLRGKIIARQANPLRTLIVIYLIFSAYLIVIPAIFVDLLPFHNEERMMSVDAVAATSRSCPNKDRLSFMKNHNFLFTLCVQKSFGDDLKHGDKLVLTGKNGLGGFLVTAYEKTPALSSHD